MIVFNKCNIKLSLISQNEIRDNFFIKKGAPVLPKAPLTCVIN